MEVECCKCSRLERGECPCELAAKEVIRGIEDECAGGIGVRAVFSTGTRKAPCGSHHLRLYINVSKVKRPSWKYRLNNRGYLDLGLLRDVSSWEARARAAELSEDYEKHCGKYLKSSKA